MRKYIQFFYKPDDGTGVDDIETLASPPAAAAEVFSATYVKELRAESKSYRLRARDADTAREKAERERDEAKQAAERAQADADTKATQRIIRAEMKALAAKEGMVDLDGLTFLDYKSISLKDDGSVEGGADALEKLKASKPYLFGSKSTSTTSKSAAPKADDAKPVDARTLSAEDYAALKASLGLR